MTKKYFILFFLVFIFLNTAFLNISFSDDSADQCVYREQINSCILENNAPNWNPNLFTAFVCLQSNNTEEITYQIVLDNKFREIDDKIEEYLLELELKKKSYLEWVQEIYNNFSKNWKYYEKYLNMCKRDILYESVACLWWKTSIFTSKDFFPESTCMNLANSKLGIYKQVAIDIIKTNKHEVRQNERKIYNQKQRWMYDEVLDMFRINLSYMERMWRKWTSKTKNTY